MERKIGEIFEYNSEWYQCINTGNCSECAFTGKRCYDFSTKGVDIIGDCTGRTFKKLEKVGEPYKFQKITIQTYKLYIEPFISVDMDFIWAYLKGNNTIDIIITQDIEDMEGNKTPLPKEDNSLTRIVYAYVNGKISDNELIKSIKEMSDEYPFEKNDLKPFSLEEAKQGKPVCTRGGRKARIICFDRVDAKPILALIDSTDGKGEDVFDYFVSGKRIANALESDLDLMMLPEKRSGWVNVYKGSVCISVYPRIYKSREDAVSDNTVVNRIDTIKISWEE